MQRISQDNHYDLFILNQHARFHLITMLLSLKIVKRLRIPIFTYVHIPMRTLKGKVIYPLASSLLLSIVMIVIILINLL